jgi:hypothetical protein
LAVLARCIAATFNGALVSEALFTFQKELFALTTALTTFGIEITSHDLP